MKTAKPKSSKGTGTSSRAVRATSARSESGAASTSVAPTAPTTTPLPEKGASSSKSDRLSPEEERFARLVALGMSQSEAYRQATGTKAKDEAVWVKGSQWAGKDAVRKRLEELRAAAKARSTEKYVYDYQDAMRECDEALEFARLAGDSKAITAAVALRSKLSGLETEARKNDRDPFDEMTPEERQARIEKLLPEAGYSIQ